ncbi:MAG: phosphatase PAP2 family protein [Clostridia bacterium]|nr:phosphatase PAP2 family protein [Clostridia bacterium]
MKKKLVLSALCFALFAALIGVVSTVDVAAIGPQETKVGLSHLNQAVHDALGVNYTLYNITEYIGYAAILTALCFAALGAWQLIRGRSLAKVDRALLMLGVLYVVLGVLYVFFEKFIVNYRPVIMPDETGPEASFPSSHTMLFTVILGSTALVAGRYIKRAETALLVRVICVVAITVGVLFRFGSGVHWLTDIIGGLLISAALLLGFSAALDKSKAA